MNDSEGLGVTPSFNQPSVSNQANVSDSTRCHQVDTFAYISFMVVYSLVFLVGLLLNGFTLKVYFCRARQQASSSMIIYLKNLAVADFLISLCLSMRFVSLASSSVSIHRVFCNIGASIFHLNMYASILFMGYIAANSPAHISSVISVNNMQSVSLTVLLFMGYIAANRYLKIVHPLGTHVLQTVRAAYIISTVTWGFLLATVSTYITLSLLTQEELPSVLKMVSCNDMDSKQLSLFSKIVHTFSAAIFLLVLVSLVFFYYSTSRRLSLAQQKQPASSGNKKLSKSRRNMLVLVSVFCVCFVPYHLVRLPYAFLRKQCSGGQVFFYLKELTIMVSVLNVCLDPLIYFLFCKAFRAQLSLRRVFSTRQVARM